MKALLEKCKATFNLQVQIPALNLRLSGPDFFNHFKEYCQSEEWKYFLDKKVQPLSDQYFSGYLANIPTGKNYSIHIGRCHVTIIEETIGFLNLLNSGDCISL